MEAIGASRGRNPENTKTIEQRLEINQEGTSNTLTSVQKDNYVVESNGIDFVGYLDGNKRIKNPTEDQLKLSRTHRQPNRIHSDRGIHPALSASEVSGRYNIMGDSTKFRIRKLTPLECFRLQGFPDNLFYKAQEVNSNSQLYKQAGNSVTVNVIEAIANRLTTI